jgi:hypothetical protein
MCSKGREVLTSQMMREFFGPKRGSWDADCILCEYGTPRPITVVGLVIAMAASTIG